MSLDVSITTAPITVEILPFNSLHVAALLDCFDLQILILNIISNYTQSSLCTVANIKTFDINKTETTAATLPNSIAIIMINITKN